MAHFYNDPKSQKELTKLVGDNPLTKDMSSKEKEHDRYENFEAIERLVSAARSMYCDGKLTWDKMTDCLCEAVEKLHGKEKKLKQIDKDAEKREGKGTSVYAG